MLRIIDLAILLLCLRRARCIKLGPAPTFVNRIHILPFKEPAQGSAGLLDGARTMLILTRDTRNNTIRIGEDIEIKVLDIRGGKVRIGIEAPDDWEILREELIES